MCTVGVSCTIGKVFKCCTLTHPPLTRRQGWCDKVKKHQTIDLGFQSNPPHWSRTFWSGTSIFIIIIINACLLKTILEINLLLYKSRPNSTQYFFIKVQVVKEVQTNNVYALKTLKKSEMLSQENVRKSLTMLCQKIGRKHFIGT